MRVAINAWFWHSLTTGSGQYARRLVESLSQIGSRLELLLVAPGRTEVRVVDLQSRTLRPIRNAGPHPTADAGWTSDGRVFYHRVQRATTQVDLAVAGPDLVATGEGLFAPGGAPPWIGASS